MRIGHDPIPGQKPAEGSCLPLHPGSGRAPLAKPVRSETKTPQFLEEGRNWPSGEGGGGGSRRPRGTSAGRIPGNQMCGVSWQRVRIARQETNHTVPSYCHDKSNNNRTTSDYSIEQAVHKFSIATVFTSPTFPMSRTGWFGLHRQRHH